MVCDDDEAIGFFEVGCYFCEEFVGSDADGGGKVQLFFDLVFNSLRDFFGASKEACAASDIEEGFIERDRFDQRGEELEDFVELLRDFDVAFHSDG